MPCFLADDEAETGSRGSVWGLLSSACVVPQAVNTVGGARLAQAALLPHASEPDVVKFSCFVCL